MKYKGKAIAPPAPEIVAFPRSEIVGGKTVVNDLVFVVKSVLDFTEFDALVPEPKAPMRISPGDAAAVPNFEEPEYKKEVQKWYTLRKDWMVLESIASPDIVWDSIDMQNPETWNNLKEELRIDAKLTPTQIQHLLNRIMIHNSIDEDKMKEARERFLTDARQLNPSGSSSQVAAQ